MENSINNSNFLSSFLLISFKDTHKECEMHSKSDNIEMMIYDKADEVMRPFRVRNINEK